jgi:predicted transcriptional regulator
VKIGTILDEEVFNRLKAIARKEGRALSAIIQDAILRYGQEEQSRRDLRLNALERFLSTRITIPNDEWRSIMEEDVYEQ